MNDPGQDMVVVHDTGLHEWKRSQQRLVYLPEARMNELGQEMVVGDIGIHAINRSQQRLAHLPEVTRPVG